ncbi:MAG: sugar ABC transporter ATP-binding protein [Christensenellales bacterium]
MANSISSEVNTQDVVLQMKNIAKHFGPVQALSDVTFQVKRGSVHILLGENGAGKSTLVKILNGIYRADKGEVFFEGDLIKGNEITPKRMLDLGIATIHQELSPVYEMTIAENVFLGREPRTRIGNVDFKKMNMQTQRLIEELGFKYRCSQKMSELTISDMQIIEIIKAISRGAKLIIMDEPTSSITGAEIKVLFEQVVRLKTLGVSVIYITHKMEEVFQIGDEATVLRDGCVIETRAIAEWDHKSLISKMVGREINDIYPKKTAPLKEVLLEAEGLCKHGVFNDINFSVRAGEIAGFFGLVGAGRTEVFRTIFGLDSYDEGIIRIKGSPVTIKSSTDAINNSIAMVSEDRKGEGLVLCSSIKENITLPSLDLYLNNGFINDKKELKNAQAIGETLCVKMSTIEEDVGNLSGGNQQKVVLAKWLLCNVSIFILDEPTRGIDVGAKYEIYKLMCDLAERGVAIVMISSELPELIGMCDRIIVMNERKIMGNLPRSEFDPESIMTLATGGKLL